MQHRHLKELIGRLERAKTDCHLILRKLQKYTVSVYTGTERRLAENHSFRLLECGAAVLDESCYDKENIGVKLEGAEKELLLF